MTISSPIGQFLAMIGGSANPALMQNANATGGSTDFRNMLMSQFSGEQAVSAESGNTPEDSKQNTVSGNNVWQLLRQQNTGGNMDNGKNSLVIHLTQRGIPADAIDGLMKAVDQSELITVLRDPALSAQLDAAIADLDMNADATMKVDASPFIKIIQKLTAAQANGETTTIDASVAEMDLEEFKEWKKLQFSDMAAFYNRPKTKLGANGEIIEVLQGPAFLHDQDASRLDTIIEGYVTITPPQYSPLQIGLQQAANGFDATMDQSNLGVAPLTRFDAAIAAQREANAMTNANGAGVNGQTANAAGQNGKTVAGTQTASNNTPSFSSFMSPEDLNAINVGGSADFMSDADAMAFHATFKTAASASNPVLTTPSAGQPHPATQMVAVSLTKNASAKGADGESHSYRLKLDPPELGRIDVEIEFEAGSKIRANLVADKPETLQLLQRDSHALLKALQDAGFDSVNNDSLSFNLSQGQNDPAGHDNSGRGNGQNAHLSGDKGSSQGDTDALETQMSVILDPITGQQRVNMVV